MRFSVKLILDIPYSKFFVKTIRITADDMESLITKAIPKRACRELEILKKTVWEEIGWKHVNMKFCFHDIQIETVFDQEKKNVAAVYISRITTGKVLSYSSPALLSPDESALAREITKRAAEARLIPDPGGYAT